MVQSKQIAVVVEPLTEEQILFKEVLHRFDCQYESVVGFFTAYLNVPDGSLRTSKDKIYKSIAKKMLPMDF